MLNDVIYVDLLYCPRFSMFNDANLRWFPHIFSVLNDETYADLSFFLYVLMTTTTLISSFFSMLNDDFYVDLPFFSQW